MDADTNTKQRMAGKSKSQEQELKTDAMRENVWAVLDKPIDAKQIRLSYLRQKCRHFELEYEEMMEEREMLKKALVEERQDREWVSVALDDRAGE